jgi:hypothetical protein
MQWKAIGIFHRKERDDLSFVLKILPWLLCGEWITGMEE